MDRLQSLLPDLRTINTAPLRPRPSVVLVATLLACGLAARPSVAQNPPPSGSVHGIIVADVPSPGGRITLPVPNATVTIADVATGTARGQTVTTLTGAFATPLQPAGSYRVCATAAGLAENCSEPAQITTDSVSLPRLLALEPQGGTLHGHVSLRDGNPAVRSGFARGTAAGAAQVSLADGGRIIAGPVSVNATGDYLLTPVAPGTNLVLSASYEAEQASQIMTLTQADLDLGTPANIVLSSAAPRIVAVTATQNGNPITAAAPGSTIVLSAQTQDDGPGPLHYRWTSNSPGLAAVDAPSVTMTLPAAPVATVVFVEITNGRGGVTHGSITIPLATGAAAGPQRLEFRQSFGPINLCLFIYCIPVHQGPFIDPTLLMNGACRDEASCEIEATAYYKAIGALNANGTPAQTGTFKGWKTAFGFSADPTQPVSGEVRAVYYNNADLRFGRDMHCRSNSSFFSQIVACYVSNYGDATHTFGSDPQTAIGNASSNTGRIATVAMVYDFVRVTPIRFGPQIYRVQFYVFSNTLNNDHNDGSLLTNAVLDSEHQKAVPGICLTCHGGQYDPAAHKAQNSNFLAFDAPSFIFSTSVPSILESSQREAIRRLNQMVETATYARPTISQLIDGWYQWCGGVGASGCYIDDVGHPYYPNEPCPSGADVHNTSCGWPQTWGGAVAQSVYQRVPRLYCRTCHVAQANFLNIHSFTDWKNQAGLIQRFVLGSQANPPILNFMPLAEVPYDAFWLDFQAQSALAAFLRANAP
jgi:hypothetical protein